MCKKILAGIAALSIIFLSIGQTAAQCGSMASYSPASYSLASRQIKPVKTESCPTCTTSRANPLDGLATLGQRTYNRELLPLTRPQNKGFPIEMVSSSTGDLAFAQNDLVFKDNPLLLFQRTYLSASNRDVGLGRGWSFAFNESIAIGGSSAVMVTSAGDSYTYRLDDRLYGRNTANRRYDNKKYVLQSSNLVDVKEFDLEDNNTISAKNGSITKIFERLRGDYHLTRIISDTGFEIVIKRHADGKIRTISGLSGEIRFEWSNVKNPRLLAVADNTGRRVVFQQSSGSLDSVSTVTGGKWRYEYLGEKLNKIIDPADRVSLRAEFDSMGRVVAVGNAVGLNHLDYQISGNDRSKITTFTDSLGYARVYQHNERGILTSINDATGNLLNIQYNADSQPVQITDSYGGLTTFDYDMQKRLTRQVTADGRENLFEYAENGKISAMTKNGERTDFIQDEKGQTRQVTADGREKPKDKLDDGSRTEKRVRKNGGSVQSTFNRRGQEIQLQIDNGRTIDFEYDEKGRRTVEHDSDIGRIERTFDATGRKVSEMSTDGLIQSYEYSADNQLVGRRNSNGVTARAERDASGNLTKIINSDNSWVKISRDEAGRITELKNSEGQSRRYFYNSRGALTRYIGADGRDLHFQYNDRGEIQSAINTQNRQTYRRMQDGRLALIQKGQSGFWRMQTISHGNMFSSTMSDSCSLFEDCWLENGTFWDDFFNSGYGDSGGFNNTCSPFAGGGGGGGGGGGYGETCYQCRSREQNNCQVALNSQLAQNGLVGTAAGAACLLGTGPAAAICIAAVMAVLAVANAEAYSARDNCLANVSSRCSSACW